MKAIAPGKLILSGEHAVVYGRPALAMAIDRSAVAEIETGAISGDARVCFQLGDFQVRESYTLMALRDFQRRVRRNYELFLEGRLTIRQVLRKPIELIQYAFIIILDGLHLKLSHGLDIRLRSNIPMGCGLGSSAAAILSVLRGIGHYFRVEFRPDWYYQYSLEVERLQHGHPSGVDTYISLHGGCARFERGAAERRPLPRLPLTLVQTGTPETTTGECVAEVRRRYGETSSIWDDFGAVTTEMEHALARNDALVLRDAVRKNHQLLHRLGVVPDRVHRFIEAVERRGGAAKVCGAGAVGGDRAGIVWVVGDAPIADLCDTYGYSLITARGEPLGARIV
ncbi:MAG: mevalonate kinase [Kiritimatiellae bacterium]|nr:mevalonate kinase [Kiritimatiellia bacterium]